MKFSVVGNINGKTIMYLSVSMVLVSSSFIVVKVVLRKELRVVLVFIQT